MNMFKSVKPTTVKEYLESVPEDRKELITFLHEFIQKIVPDLKPHFASNMIGYGSFKYKNYKKEIIDWPTVALANQKNYVSIYVCAVDAGEYVAEKYKDKLGSPSHGNATANRGKVSVGKSCIRFKKKADINLDMLKEVIQLAAQKPGLDGVGASKKKS